ncbi:MAG: cyclase family protein [Desulfobacterales bacterium]|nr:MAG: cyclase family protein [Desulfobacterales bacterium]
MKEAQIIDLCYPINSEMLVFPGTARPVFQWVGKLNSEGFNLTPFSMWTHAGTPGDAPSHFAGPSGKPFDRHQNAGRRA